MARYAGACPTARWVRAGSAATLCTSAAWASHRAVGGVSPEPQMLLAALGGALLICVLLTGRRMGPKRVAVAAVLSQGVYHVLFSAPAGTFGPLIAPEPTPHLQHGALNASAAHAISGGGTHVPMFAAHVVAATVAFWVVRQGENSWWMLRDAVSTRVLGVLCAVLVLVPALRPTRPSVEFFRPRLRETEWVRGHVSRRGPPARAARFLPSPV